MLCQQAQEVQEFISGIKLFLSASMHFYLFPILLPIPLGAAGQGTRVSEPLCGTWLPAGFKPQRSYLAPSVGFLRGERVLLITPWISSHQRSVWMGIRESWMVLLVVEISTFCSSTLSNPTTERSSKRLCKVDSCLISSVSKAAVLKAYQNFLGSLKYPLVRESMPRMPRASGQVTMGCLCHSFPVRLTSVSNAVSCQESADVSDSEEYKAVTHLVHDVPNAIKL